MKPDFKQFFSKNMNTKGLVIILIIGIGLLLLPDFFFKNHTMEKEGKTAITKDLNMTDYEKKLEARLERILSSVKGIEQVSVMITLEDMGEDYFAKNEKNEEKTSLNNTGNETLWGAEGALALKNDSGGGQSPVLLKTGTPKISGVLVVAKGAAAPEIKTNILSAVHAVFNVPLHRIEVLEKS